MFLNMMQDWAGWLLILFSFSIVLMWKSVRSDTKVVHAIWFCIVLHHAVALVNTYVGTVVGADLDASKFHSTGVALAGLPKLEWVIGRFADGEIIVPGEVSGHWISESYQHYMNSLGYIYRAFGPSLLLGGELSVLAFTLSCVVLVRLVSLLDLERFRIGIILLFGLLPSAAILRSVTLRESWQALFFLLSVYWAIRLRKRPGILIFSFMLMSAFCMALLHEGLRGYIIFFLPISIWWGIIGRKKTVHLERCARFLFAGLLIACVIMLIQKIGWYLTFEDALNRINHFHQASTAKGFLGRTNFAFPLDASSVLGIVKTIPMIFAQYMFAPFPWQVENVKDICALLESMLRFVLLFFAVSSWRRSSGDVRSYYSFLLIIYLGLELLWALGAINWGTAIRHHVLGHSVIVLLGGPGLILFMRNLHFVTFERRKVSGFLDREKVVKPDPKMNEI